jgi:hypothetical protein
VCDAAPVALNAPRVKPVAEPDPTEGLPADASELNSPAARAAGRPPEGRPRAWVVAAVTFALGLFCGVGGVLGVQAIDWSSPATPENPEVAAKPEDDSASGTGNAPPPARVAVAPMPHEGGVTPIAFVEPDTDFELPVRLPPPGVIETHQVNKEMHYIPTMKKGEHVILKGKVNTLRIHGMDAGAVLDASGLEAAVIIVSGTISNRSTLKLYAPKGSVQISHKITGKSRVEINAPEGDVRFMVTTVDGGRDGAKIDDGATVAITARAVEFKGDIAGTDTKVSVTLSPKAWMRFTSISGSATVEYKSQIAMPPPDITVGTVARTATFRKVE